MSLGSDIPVPRRAVFHTSWSEGYRTGTRLHFVLECGHTESRSASRGRAKAILCRQCWAIAVCDAKGHSHRNGNTPCGRCAKPREWLGRAAEIIARYSND